MPHVPTMMPSTRFFARLDRFECECPNCGRLLFAALDMRRAPNGLWGINARRTVAKSEPRRKSVRNLTWNPYSQRLCCPWCRKSYVCGLLVFPVKNGMWRLVRPPFDAKPNKRELAEIRRRAGGWYLTHEFLRGEHANLAVQQPCVCPETGLEVPDCPVHGAIAAAREEAKEALPEEFPTDEPEE
ncbi:MAG TPA: hypothetical protein VKD72_23545 [Gemmataceae bacterium]|nr:hypothetical protein [Gemmataceae bacterium]